MQTSEARLLRGVLPFLVLKVAETQSFHGYQLIKLIRRKFGVYFGPSTIYPLLRFLEEEGLLASTWQMDAERPRRVYMITDAGVDAINALTSTMQAATRFEGHIPQPQPPRPGRRNVLTLEH